MNICLFISVYLSSLPVAHLSDAPQKTVSCYRQGYRTKLLRILPGSLKHSAYSTVTWDLGLTSHAKDKLFPQFSKGFYFRIIQSELCGKGLTLSQSNPVFYVSAAEVFLKTLWEKKKLLIKSNSSFSCSV